MHVHTLRCEMLVRKTLAETFAVFEDPHNLARITPSWLNFKVTSKEQITMRKGAEITYRIKWLGFLMNWKTLITEYEPPFLFVDQQEEGPYVLWRHRHTFANAPGGTKVGDQVDYALPMGPLGRLAHSVVVRNQLLSIFRFRQAQLSEIFGADTVQLAGPSVSP